MTKAGQIGPRHTPGAGALIAAVLVAALAGCGGDEPRSEPSQRDVLQVSASIGQIVLQCRQVSAGYVEGPDDRSLTRGVDTLVSTYERVQPDAAIVVEGLPGEARRTTMRERLDFALRRLRSCSPPQAQRVREALAG